MKTKNCSKAENDSCQTNNNEKLISRREVLNKVGLYALSTATMMVLMKSQPAKAQSPLPAANINRGDGEVWQRTTRNNK